MFISTALAATDGAHHAVPFYADPTFWVAVAFVVVVGFAFRPVGRAMGAGLDARAQRIRTQLDEARKLREDAQALLAEYQRKQRDALQEAEGIVVHAKAEAARQEKAAAEALEAAIARREQQAVERIAQAEAQALAEVRSMAVDLAVDAAQRLIIQKVSAAQGDILIDAAIQELPGKLH